MIRHIALFRWRDGTTEAEISALQRGLSELPTVIPGIDHYHFGPDLGIGNDTWDFAVVADLVDEEAFASYRSHPAHRRVIDELLAPIRADRASVQYSI